MAKTCDCCGVPIRAFSACERLILSPHATLELCDVCVQHYDGLIVRNDKQRTINAIEWCKNRIDTGSVNPEKTAALSGLLLTAEKWVNECATCHICGKDFSPDRMNHSSYNNCEYELCESCWNHFIGMKNKPNVSDIQWATNALNQNTVASEKADCFRIMVNEAERRKQILYERRSISVSDSATEDKTTLVRLLSYVMEVLGGVVLGGWVGASIYDISILLGAVVGGWLSFTIGSVSFALYQHSIEQKKQNRELLEKIKDLENKINQQK